MFAKLEFTELTNLVKSAKFEFLGISNSHTRIFVQSLQKLNFIQIRACTMFFLVHGLEEVCEAFVLFVFGSLSRF